MRDTKQVIVIRKDLKMSRGKEISQGCHASMAFLTRGAFVAPDLGEERFMFYQGIRPGDEKEIYQWLNNSFKKIVVYVNSEDELMDLYHKAKEKGLMSHLVIDNGATEFNNVPTRTAVAIGPHFSEKFEGLTNHLPLL